uniref:Uncharacterized protein n=1 Tax=Salix viminalis TaxID=40686 RepID=A0A6N2KWG9_SALVM
MWPGARRRRRREKEGEPNLKGPAQPERPRPTGAVDEEEGKGPYHLAEKGKRPINQPAVVQSCDIDRFSFNFARFVRIYCPPLLLCFTLFHQLQNFLSLDCCLFIFCRHHPIQWKLYLNLSEVTRMIKLSSN